MSDTALARFFGPARYPLRRAGKFPLQVFKDLVAPELERAWKAVEQAKREKKAREAAERKAARKEALVRKKAAATVKQSRARK